MPQLIIRGMRKQDIQAISKTMVDQLTDIIGCPRDYFTIECLETAFIRDGQGSGRGAVNPGKLV